MSWSRLLPGLDSLQNVHPLIVHFPLAFLIAAAVVYPAAWIARRESWARMAFWLLVFGVITALIALWTGLRAGAGVMVAPSVRERILEHHEQAMLTATGVALVLVIWANLARPMPRRGRVIFMLLIGSMAVTLIKGADLGAWMVFGYNAGGSLPQPIELRP